MVKPLSPSAIDVALWFMHKAAYTDIRLQPAALHALLFVSSGLYGATYQGHKLMPASFLVSDFGPIEASVYRLLELDIESLYDQPNLPETAEKFLDIIWNRYSGAKIDKLIDFTQNNIVYIHEKDRNGIGAELDFSKIIASFKKNTNREEKIVHVENGREFKEWRPKDVNEVVPRIKRQLEEERKKSI